MPNNPCKGCEQRSVTCHGGCEAYRSWAAQRRAETIETNKQKACLDKMWNYGRKGSR